MAKSFTDSTAKKKAKWLEAYAEHRSVTAASKCVQIDRKTAYNWRDRDEDFADAWKEISEQTIDDLEASAMRRAIEGVREHLYYKGEPVLTANGEHAYIQRYETPLTIFMLKALRAGTYHLEKKEMRELGESAGGVIIAPPGLTPEEWIKQAKAKAKTSADKKKTG